MNDTYKGQPRPITLIKVARASEGIVSPEELLIAGGFNPENYLCAESEEAITDKIYSQNCILFINEYLSQLHGESWKLTRYGVKQLFDLSGTVENDSSKNRDQFYFKFVFEESTNRQVLRHKLDYIYGKLCVTDFNPYCDDADGFVYTIITNNKDFFNQACDYKPINLSMNIQIILTDKSGSSFIEDYLLCLVKRVEDPGKVIRIPLPAKKK